MCSVNKILHIFIGLNVIKMSETYSAGNYPGFTASCGTLLPDHKPFTASTGEAPFRVSPLNIYTQRGAEVSVMLQSKSTATFKGFMLDVRKSTDLNEPSVGKFKPNSLTTLHDCYGLVGSAVSHVDKRKMTEVNVTWIAPETGTFYFRASFVEDYRIFWKPNDIVPVPDPSTTSTAPSTTSTVSSTTSTDTSTASTVSSTTSTDTSTTSTAPSTTSTAPSTTSTAPSTTSTAPSTTSTAPSTTSTVSSTTSTDTSTASTVSSTTSTAPSTTSTAPSTISTAPSTTSTAPSTISTSDGNEILGFNTSETIVSASILASILVTNSLPHHVRIMNVLSICCAEAVDIFIIILLHKTSLVCLIGLVGSVMILGSVKIILVSLRLGPSHELRHIRDLAVKCVSVFIEIVTVAAVFVGLRTTDDFDLIYQLGVMVGYTVWRSLFWIAFKTLPLLPKPHSTKTRIDPLGTASKRKPPKINNPLYWILATIIFSIINIVFTVFLLLSIFD